MTAILWDFGGVFTSSPFEAFNTLEERLGAPKDFIRQTNAINPDTNAWAKFESNSVSLHEFDTLFANESEARGHRIPGKDVIAMLSGTLPFQCAAATKCRRYAAVLRQGIQVMCPEHLSPQVTTLLASIDEKDARSPPR